MATNPTEGHRSTDESNTDESKTGESKTGETATADVAAHQSAANHGRLPGVLVAVATFVAILAVFSTWVRTQALDTDEWVELSSDLIDEPEVTAAISGYVVDEIYEATDVKAEFEDLLPADLEGLAGPLAAAAREPATESVERLLQSDRFESLWAETNRAAHEQAVAILRDDTGTAISTADGQVTLELGLLLEETSENLGLSTGLLDNAPPDAGRIVVFESDELDAAQQAMSLLHTLSWFLFLLVVFLYALAVYLAPGRRIAVLRSVGFGLAAAGVIVLIVRVIAVRLVVDAIVDDPAVEPVANVTAYVLTGLLRQMAWSGVIYGVLILLFTSLLGESRLATATRRTLSPALNASTGAVVAGTTVLILLLVWWSPGRSFSNLTTGLVLIGLVIGAVITLRARTQQEFGAVTFEEVAGSAGQRVEAAARDRRAGPKAPNQGDDLVIDLESLRALHADGSLSDAEFETAKRAVLTDT